MDSRSTTTHVSNKALLAGRILTGIAILFLVFDLTIKLMATEEAVTGTVALGYAAYHLPILAVIELFCLVLYLIPRTAPFGAILWTGYLGGDLRDGRVRALINSAR